MSDILPRIEAFVKPILQDTARPPIMGTPMNAQPAIPIPWIEKSPFRWLVYGLGGSILLAWLALTPGGLLGKADAVAYAVCHRIAAHSLSLGDRQLPLCARCTGMYLGAVLGLGFQHFQGRRGSLPALRYVLLFGPMVVFFGVDGVNSYLHFFPHGISLYAPQNWLRLVSGTGMGLTISAVLAPAFRQTLWETWEPIPAFSGLKPYLLLIGLAAGMDLLVLSGIPIILYPLALLSAAGVLLLLGMIYTMVLVMLFKAENRFSRINGLKVFVVGGLILALLQISLLDAGRYWLTGTWQGFSLLLH